MKTIALFACLAASLMAADLSGKWAGTVAVEDPSDGSTINTEVRAELRQTVDAVAGTIGRKEDHELESIQKGKLEGNRLTFEVSSAEANGLVKFTLTLAGDRLDGEMSGAMEGTPLTGKVHLIRQHNP